MAWLRVLGVEQDEEGIFIKGQLVIRCQSPVGAIEANHTWEEFDVT